jgi:hypothetical protein
MKYNFKVGQIAYINYSKKRLIIPVKIVEQIVRKTEHEELVDWNLITPDKNSLLCSELVDPVYSTLEDAKAALLKSADNAIQKMADVCLEIQNKTWPVINNSNIINTHVKDIKNLDKIKITLSDGTIANIAVPDIALSDDVNQEE